MFGSDLLEVLIGIVFIYILVSIICSAVREVVEAWLQTRSAYLEHGIRELLHDVSGTGLAGSLYRHPLIYGLYMAEYDPQPRPHGRLHRVRWLLKKGQGLPSYIPSRNFAVALMDLAARGPSTDAFSSSAGSTQITLGNIRRNVASLRSPAVQRALLTAVDTAEGDLKKLQKNLENWYDSGMDRVSGWYKRSTQWIVFWIGLLVAMVFNVNTITIADFLYKNDAARQVLVARAEAAAMDSGFVAMVDRQRPAATPAPVPPPAGQPATPADSAALDSAAVLDSAAAARPADSARADSLRADSVRAARAAAASSDFARARAALDSLGLPIGWSNVQVGEKGKKADVGDWVIFILLSLLGWAATGMAATMGAPFWFDVLNKVMVIRSTVKPREKSPEEGSEDRPKKAGGTDVQVDVTAGGERAVAGTPPGTPPVPPPAEPLPEADSGDVEADVDACDVEFEDETPDEALPMAKGGVA